MLKQRDLDEEEIIEINRELGDSRFIDKDVNGSGAGPEYKPVPRYRRAVTLRDVAKAAQVDTSTASRALRPSTRNLVRPDTLARVLSIAEELGYRVNPIARGLRDQRTMTIGMILPDLANPLFPPIVRGIEDGLREAGYVLILANTDRDNERERNLVETLLSRQVDGLILATAERDYPLLEEISERVPTVLVNRTTDDSLVSSITSDDHQGMGQAVKHLAELGHTRIAHVGGTQRASTGSHRYQQYLAWMLSEGLEVDPDLVVFTDWFTQDLGTTACLALLDRGVDFTAIIAGNDLIALGCYSALNSRGLRVPQDVSVVGYNGIKFCDVFSPPLTSIHVPKYDLGLRAASLILEAIEKPDAPAVAVRVPTTIQVRASTATPPKARK
jgi:LacI family transcriptional regulator